MHVDNLGTLDADILDRLGVASPSYWYSELERLHVMQVRRGAGPSYVVARDPHGTPVGLLPVYTAPPPWESNLDPAALFDPPVPVGDSRLGLGGSAGGYANYLAVDAAAGGPQAQRIAGALVDRARALAAGAGCRHLLLPYLDQAQWRCIEGYGPAATAVGQHSKAVLPVRWDSFEDYLAWLPRKRQRHVLDERRQFQGSGIRLREEQLLDVATDLAPLLTDTENRYGRGVDLPQIHFYLSFLGMHLDGDCRTLVAYRDERPVAFSLLVLRGDYWIVKAWGCDNASVRSDALYFNLVYYEPIRRAIAEGARLLDFGVGALKAKTLRGCELEPLRTILLDTAPSGKSSNGA